MVDWEQIKATKKRFNETSLEFAQRLDDLGAAEIAARMRLRMEYKMTFEEAAEVCGQIDGLRVREIQNDANRHRGRSKESQENWILRNFPVDLDEARRLMDLAEK